MTGNQMILWLKTTPTKWTQYNDVYKDAAECETAKDTLVAIVKAAQPEFRLAFIDLWHYGSVDQIGIYFFGCF